MIQQGSNSLVQVINLYSVVISQAMCIIQQNWHSNHFPATITVTVATTQNIKEEGVVNMINGIQQSNN